ncbi:DUF2150 family protein [Halomarina litorea]|uniref:DUF2150 family protein n=1 Tax=Halomarina litorea TaxID=2961595 RepID=UPI0020C28270|nr:DUF2150 family protein [Halomarina sp. BCD28]
MSTPEGEYYTAERWQNWLDRLDEESVDLEDEDSARLRLNLQDDAVIAVAKIVSGYEEGDLEQEAALEELAGVRDIVLSDIEGQFEDEDTVMLVDAVQTSLVCVFYAAEEYVAGGPVEEGTVEAYVEAAVDAEDEEDLDAALGYCAQAGTLIIDGHDLDMAVAEDIEYGLVAEWVNGLDSLYEAMRDPEVVEEEDDE